MARSSKPSRREASPPPPGGYPSAADIPSFRELRDGLAAMKLLTTFSPKMRSEVKRQQSELDRMTSTIDGFYRVLSGRNWVFHDQFQLTEIADRTAQGADALEAALIAFYAGEHTLNRLVGQLRRHPQMSARMALVERAAQDHLAGRFYAVVLTLLAVMDGFTNDLSDMQKGLHAREAEDVVAWNSIAGHHAGLAMTQAAFTQRFTKVSDAPTFELHRNGIMHGVLTNFDNPVVASKAWNRLFAVADLATSLSKGSKPQPTAPSLRALGQQLVDLDRHKKRLAAWQSTQSTSELIPRPFAKTLP